MTMMLTRIPLTRAATSRLVCSRSVPVSVSTVVVAAAARRQASSFGAAPGPPKLPAKEQAEFERLQREAAVSSAFQPVGVAEAEAAEAAAADTTSTPTTTTTTTSAAGSELNEGGGLYRGARPEFDGDKNPRTGEVGGPKNEPLRWGSEGDWSYNGKVTDF
ncbi:hypothetical protein V2A60_009765 [Cordyceps javanica]|uniref:Succinate dehydrogenase assembly factor 4, mitochondrial n=1 Tax=Cordyceps javanica TaxID=43265 RepID=A0A545V0D8_9HYPO|nr:FMP21-like protein [Cordyceps javanica]TQW05622.1 FMP21-like protein [Cordyceps javanica]